MGIFKDGAAAESTPHASARQDLLANLRQAAKLGILVHQRCIVDGCGGGNLGVGHGQLATGFDTRRFDQDGGIAGDPGYAGGIQQAERVVRGGLTFFSRYDVEHFHSRHERTHDLRPSTADSAQQRRDTIGPAFVAAERNHCRCVEEEPSGGRHP